jgi:hypothetical protein
VAGHPVAFDVVVGGADASAVTLDVILGRACAAVGLGVFVVGNDHACAAVALGVFVVGNGHACAAVALGVILSGDDDACSAVALDVVVDGVDSSAVALDVILGCSGTIALGIESSNLRHLMNSFCLSRILAHLFERGHLAPRRKDGPALRATALVSCI